MLRLFQVLTSDVIEPHVASTHNILYSIISPLYSAASTWHRASLNEDRRITTVRGDGSSSPLIVEARTPGLLEPPRTGDQFETPCGGKKLVQRFALALVRSRYCVNDRCQQSRCARKVFASMKKQKRSSANPRISLDRAKNIPHNGSGTRYINNAQKQYHILRSRLGRATITLSQKASPVLE